MSSSGRDADEQHVEPTGSCTQFLVERREREGATLCQFQVGGVIKREAEAVGEMQDA